jgi:hypothetical protein
VVADVKSVDFISAIAAVLDVLVIVFVAAVFAVEVDGTSAPSNDWAGSVGLVLSVETYRLR